jgi:capsular polysaccharide transport system ATP-binding protein
MIHFKNVSKYYALQHDRHYIFKDLTLDLPTDQNIAVLGPNGAGKSTLIRLLGGTDLVSRGHIQTDKNISWPLGLQGGLQGSMTARENVRFVARIHGYRKTEQIEAEVAEFADIGIFFDEPVKTYSSGMRSRVTFGLTMAFAVNFDLLLIDEIGAVGDANFKKKSEQLLEDCLGSTRFIMVSHSMKYLKQHCNAGVVILNQNLAYYDNLEEAIDLYQRTYIKAS